jgi:hypothetical protein
MKQFQQRLSLLILLMLIVAVACRPQTAPTESAAPEAPTVVSENLPLLPSFLDANTNGIGDPLPGGAEDPFAAATSGLATELPGGMETAVVQQHNFGQLDEGKARALANQFGFTGPLYVQQIPPEFAPPPDTEVSTIYVAFSGLGITNFCPKVGHLH